MKVRIVVCSVLVAVVAVVPTASARTERVQRTQASQGIAGGVATSVAAEIAKSGIKAAVAKWAPDLTKYVDPVAAGLAEIQAQLAEISSKLTQLIDHQYALEAKLNCVIQRTALNPVLSDARTWFNTLRDQQYVSSLSAREQNLESLFTERHRMLSDQDHLHSALIGSDGLIRACAQHIEEGLRPFLSGYLAYEVHNFYAIYHTAAAELLVVRANMMAFHPTQFPANDAENAAKTVESWWTGEQGYIKPYFPEGMSYDTQSGWLWRYHYVAYHETTLRHQLQTDGWHVTGYSTIPTCSAVETEFKKSGLTGSAAISYLRQHNIINIPYGDVILCYDDSDRLHEFNLRTYSYAYAGDVQSYAPSVAARPNNGLVNIADFSYLSH